MSKRKAKAIDWRKRTTAVQLDEITDAMLEPLRRQMAGEPWPCTAWPSRYFGEDFLGTDYLLTLSWENRAEDSAPFVTLLPDWYYPTWRTFIPATACGGELCSGCGHQVPAGPAFTEPGSWSMWCPTCVHRIEAVRAGQP